MVPVQLLLSAVPAPNGDPRYLSRTYRRRISRGIGGGFMEGLFINLGW